jgi:hypothetical protein
MILTSVATAAILGLGALLKNKLKGVVRAPATVKAILARLIEMDEKRDEASERNAKKDKVIFRALLAICEALEGNCNGNVTTAKKHLNDYLTDTSAEAVAS